MRRRGGVLLLTTLLSGACDVPAPERDDHAVRAAAFEAQSRPGEWRGEWDPWYQELARVSRVNQPFEPLFLTQGTEQIVHDDTLVEHVLDEKFAPGSDGPLATLRSVARQLRAAGIDFLVVPVPPRSVVYPELILPCHAPLLDGELPPLLDWRARRIYARLEREGIEVLDLLPAFLAERYHESFILDWKGRKVPYRELLFMAQDPHWSPRASVVAARLVAARIRRYPWFEEMESTRGRARVQEGEDWMKVRGPTASSLVEEGRLSPDYPRERFRRYVAWIEGEEWSHQDRGSPILVLGDSYAQDRWCLPDQLLARLRTRVDIVAVAGGFQSSQLRALRLRGDGLAGKRLVIWEICAHSFSPWVPWIATDLGARPAAAP